MSTPVITSKWAGNFDCGVCHRKRLMADEFSKSNLDKHRKTGQAINCKQCTAKQEQEKRMEARNKSTDNKNNDDDDGNHEERTCAGSCHHLLPKDSYNRNQWSKLEGKSRCRLCVEKSIIEDEKQERNKKEGKIDVARKKVEDLKLSKSATAREIVAAESELAAFEAESVTGLKPIRMGGRGRGGGGKRSYGRGGRGGRGSERGKTRK